MKLELKHLAPYPEDLKIFDGTGYYNYKGFSYSNKKVFLSKENEFPKNKALFKCKLVLYPLSDLAKDKSQDAYQIRINLLELDDDVSILSYQLFGYLLEKHYDVFELIPEGLAIDKNTLK